MTMLKGFGTEAPFSNLLLVLSLISGCLTGAVAGALLAAKSSRCLVTLLRPIRMWEAIAGFGGAETPSPKLPVFLFRFLPLEG